MRVANLGFEKAVSVVSPHDSSPLTEEPLPWAANFGDYDVFAGKVGRGSSAALRYAAAGAVFWDNNNGWDYGESTGGIGSNAVGGNVTLDHVRVSGSGAGASLSGEIWVNNLSFAKSVGIRYSADGGASWRDVYSSYSHPVTVDLYDASSSRVEAWAFNASPADGSGFPFQLAVFYRNHSNGQTYWDNNLGRDYRVGKIAGALLG